MQAVDAGVVLEHADIKTLTAKEWRDRLLASVHQPVQQDLIYPGFPNEEVQRTFVGSAYEDALNEGYRFYAHIQNHLARPRLKVGSRRYLDFGCGWGRIGRFFLRDFERGDMAAVDVDPGMVSFCQSAHIPGSFFTIPSDGPLPFASSSFALVTAYSVFSHLPERLFRLWLAELLRVTAPGGLIAFTVEPERFLDFVANVDPQTTPSPWYASLHAKLGDLDERRRELRSKGLTYLPTGGGPYRPVETYGDTVVTQAFIENCIAGQGSLVSFLDRPEQFWQAVVVIRKNRSFLPFLGSVGR